MDLHWNGGRFNEGMLNRGLPSISRLMMVDGVEPTGAARGAMPSACECC